MRSLSLDGLLLQVKWRLLIKRAEFGGDTGIWSRTKRSAHCEVCSLELSWRFDGGDVVPEGVERTGWTDEIILQTLGSSLHTILYSREES